MVRINTQYKVIDLEDGDGKIVGQIRFDTSDENVKRLQKVYKEIEMEAEKNKSDSEHEFGIFLKKAIDEMLGEGTFDKLFELSPSLSMTAVNFYKIANEIQRSIEKDTKLLLKNKYLKKKNRKKGR